MSLDVQPLALPDVKIIRTRRLTDSRGVFSETYSRRTFHEAGIALEFVQDNHSVSTAAGVVRGLHYQGQPFAQDKLVRVVRGRIFDVAVDIRRSSPTFSKWVAAELSADQWNQMLIPAGFAHGFCTLEPDTEVIYKVTNFYAPEHDFGIRWNDPELAIAWPVLDNNAALSEKDAGLPFFKDVTHWL